MVNLVSEENGLYSIQVDGEEVGYLETRTGTIVQIEVLPAKRGNGYGTDAITEYLKIMKQQDYYTIETTAVVSPAFESILLDIGFEPTDDPMTNSYKYRFDQ